MIQKIQRETQVFLGEISSFCPQEKPLKVAFDPAQKLRIGVYLGCHVHQSQIAYQGPNHVIILIQLHCGRSASLEACRERGKVLVSWTSVEIRVAFDQWTQISFFEGVSGWLSRLSIFGSGHDLVHGFKPYVGLCGDSLELALDSVSPSLPPPLVVLRLSNILKFEINLTLSCRHLITLSPAVQGCPDTCVTKMLW